LSEMADLWDNCEQLFCLTNQRRKRRFCGSKSAAKTPLLFFGQRPSQSYLSDRGWTHQRRTPFSTAEATSPRSSSTSRCPRTSEIARKRLMGSRRGNRERVSS